MGCHPKRADDKGIKEGGGVKYTTKEGYTFIAQQIDGKMYDVTDLGEFPKLIGTGMSGEEVLARLNKTGNNPEILSPQQMQERVTKRNEERRNLPDYELGAGVPWGNREHRKVARRAKIRDRAMKRK